MGTLKFIHASDIHLDSPLQSIILRDEAKIERMRRACREAFEKLIDFAIEQQAAFVLLAGDLYDHDTPNMQIAIFLRNQLSRLNKKGIRVVIVKGNHDADNRITSALALPGNTKILNDKKPETVRYDDLSTRIAIHGQSFRAGPIAENLAAAYPPAVAGYLNIGVLHTSLAGSTEHDPYAPCKLEDLTTRGYDYWALGHIHKAATLSRDPWVVYPGNLQGRHAKETGPKGCVLITVDDDRISAVEAIDLAVVRWQQLEINLDTATNEAELISYAHAALSDAYRDADGRPVAIRVVLAGTTPLYDLIEGEPDRILQTILELAGEVGGEDIWIEKIQNETRPTETPATAREGGNELLQIIDEIAGDPSRIEALLRKELDPLKRKLPEGLKDLDVMSLLDDRDALKDAVRRLKPRLATLLSGDGGA
jgi:exonuclease SbcD